MKLAIDVFMEDVEARRVWTCCTSSHNVGFLTKKCRG